MAQNPPKLPQKPRPAAGATVRYSFQKLLTGSDLSQRRLPRMALRSPNPGPAVWLTGCVHGDEVGGLVIIHEVFRNLRPRLLNGALHAFPLLNPTGFEVASRTIPITRQDLNRAFPGNPGGLLADRMARLIFNAIAETAPALVLDLHNDWRRSIPYALLDDTPQIAQSPARHAAAQAAAQSGFPVILDTDDCEGTLSYSLLQRDIPAITLELGESYVINERNIQIGVQSVCAILASLGMIEPPPAPHGYPLPPALVGQTLRYSHLPLSSASGIVRFAVRPGDVVRKGHLLARIYNAFGKLLEKVVAQDDGIVLGHSDYSVTFPGMPILAFGVL